MSWEKQFIEDYKNLQRKTFREKYFQNVPSEITISGILVTAKKENLIEVFVDPVWYGDTRDRNDYYLIKNKDVKFEVFLSEIGGKHWLRVYDHLDDAVFRKLDLNLNALGLLAIDTRMK